MATKTRTTIGQNPLDAVIPDLHRHSPQTAATNSEQATEPQPKADRKERLTIHLPQSLIERLKNAVYWTPGLTLAELGETALTRLVDELEAERGATFETRTGELKGGRPLKRP